MDVDTDKGDLDHKQLHAVVCHHFIRPAIVRIQLSKLDTRLRDRTRRGKGAQDHADQV